MKNFFVSRAYTILSCRDRKHSGKKGMVTGLICSIALSVNLLAKPQDSPSQATTSQEASAATEPARRALPAPLDGIFPGSDYLGPTPLIGVPDTDPVWPLTKALWDASPGAQESKDQSVRLAQSWR